MGREFELKLAEEQIAILRQSITQLKAEVERYKAMYDGECNNNKQILAENGALRDTIAKITRTTPILTEESDD